VAYGVREWRYTLSLRGRFHTSIAVSKDDYAVSVLELKRIGRGQENVKIGYQQGDSEQVCDM
jgi:hypothetical protein